MRDASEWWCGLIGATLSCTFPCLIGLTSVLVYEVTVFRGQSLDGDNLLLTPYLNSQSRKVLSYSPFY